MQRLGRQLAVPEWYTTLEEEGSGRSTAWRSARCTLLLSDHARYGRGRSDAYSHMVVSRGRAEITDNQRTGKGVGYMYRSVAS